METFILSSCMKPVINIQIAVNANGEPIAVTLDPFELIRKIEIAIIDKTRFSECTDAMRQVFNIKVPLPDGTTRELFDYEVVTLGKVLRKFEEEYSESKKDSTLPGS